MFQLANNILIWLLCLGHMSYKPINVYCALRGSCALPEIAYLGNNSRVRQDFYIIFFLF